MTYVTIDPSAGVAQTALRMSTVVTISLEKHYLLHNARAGVKAFHRVFLYAVLWYSPDFNPRKNIIQAFFLKFWIFFECGLLDLSSHPAH